MTTDTKFVAVVGGANIDIHGRSAKALKSRDSNPGSVHTSAGGVARNIAENLARLGVDTRLVSAVGDDPQGKMLLDVGRDAGLDMAHVQQIDSMPTSVYLSVLDNLGEMQVAISDMGIVDQLDADRLQQHQAMLERSALIVLDTNLPDDALAWLTATFAKHTLFVDTVSAAKAPRIRSYLKHVHTLKTGTIEAEALSGLKARTTEQLVEFARWSHKHGVKRLFVTRGEKGVFFSTGDAQGSHKLHDVQAEVLNAGGAGDAFAAGLAYAWLEDWPLGQTLEFALAAAAVTLSDNASSSPTLSLAAVRQILEDQHAS
jgi:pseudouridine kinase